MSDNPGTYGPSNFASAAQQGFRQAALQPGSTMSLDGPSKAAIVLLSLQPELAGEILRLFSAAEIQKITSLLGSVRSLEREVLIEVLQEFKDVTELRKQVAFDPQEFAAALAQKFAPQASASGSPATLLARSVPALELLSNMPVEQLYLHLQDEHPQVMATLLALLPAELAASVLEQCDASMRDELVLRIALLDRVDPSALIELNEMLSRTLSQDLAVQIGSVGGARPVAEILSLLSGGGDQHALKLVRDHDAKLADKIQKRMFSFEDFVQIAPQALQRLLPEVPIDVLVTALKGASPNVQDFFFANMTRGKAEKVRFEINGLPPVRVQEVEARQREIVQIARQMQDNNQISLDRIGADVSFDKG